MIPYQQSTPFTTAAASLLNILHHFTNLELTKENEFDIWHKTALLPTRASSIYALASYAKQQGLHPKIILENDEYSFPDYRFYRYKKEDIEQAAFSEKIYHEKALQHKISIENRDIMIHEIQALVKDNILLLRLNTKPIRQEKRNTSNYIIVHGFKDNHFHIIDPAFGSLSIPTETIKEAFDTLETKKFRDHRMIIFPR